MIYNFFFITVSIAPFISPDSLMNDVANKLTVGWSDMTRDAKPLSLAQS